MKQLLLTISIGVFFFAMTQSVKAQSTTDKWVKAKIENMKFKYPSNWELNESGMMGTTMLLFSELTSEEDKFKDNVNLMVQDVSAYKVDLDAFVEISEKQFENVITDYKPILSERVEGKKDAYHRFLYNGTQGIFQLTIEQYCWVVEGKAYILTFTTEEDQYEVFKETGHAIMNSFSIK